MKTVKNIFKIAFITVFALTTTSCSDDDPVTTPEAESYSENINNIASNVIVVTYNDLATKGSLLFDAATEFKSDRTTANLDATKQAWRSARQPWEQSEGFLFGPVDDLGIDPAIDSWPVNVTDMTNLLNDTTNVPTITETTVSQQANEAKGFHLIEYLLWGIDGNKELADFSDRQIDYLVAACENLKIKTAELSNAWDATSGNYVDNFLTAGQSTNQVYSSQKNAILDIVTGMIAIADEVGNGKIENPFNGNSGAGDETQEESRFSHNSKIDFANNIRSISNTYHGKYNTDGKGISDIVVEFDDALDAKFQQEITDAITAIEAIPGTFTTAITNNRAAIETAQEKVQTVQVTLESEIKPLINNNL
ncbi:putative iron-regulated protein [Tenacibaculum adriaticum]|uniref:Putative iron-regulated protein n=1 Tax=Tenacibaculum adriaticum TaxID=413713 RepID=A0A5S5DSC9_9FLAO|nr:imelysin family protein [Tenacibaculum adriaticum]TYP98791.1 putative iron-regulated protein [Tenacibaculum adriaticum]